MMSWHISEQTDNVDIVIEILNRNTAIAQQACVIWLKDSYRTQLHLFKCPGERTDHRPGSHSA